jgi:hypothetical protein
METNKKEPSEKEKEPQILEEQLGIGKLDKKEQANAPDSGKQNEAPNNPAGEETAADSDIPDDWQNPENHIMG